MKNKTLSIATLLLTGALLFAGCGQTGNTTGNTPSTTAGQETATTEQTDSTAQTASDSTASTNDIFTNMDTTDIDGNKMDSSIFAKNKVTLVNVWNVGCTPCVNEILILIRSIVNTRTRVLLFTDFTVILAWVSQMTKWLRSKIL